MTTMLSFKEVTYIPGVRITTDTNQERAVTVTLQNGKFSNSRRANLDTIITTQKINMTRQKKAMTLITVPLWITFIFKPSRKIQNF